MAITLIENFRAVFYTPFYAAFALRAYEAEGIEVQKSMDALVAELNRIAATITPAKAAPQK